MNDTQVARLMQRLTRAGSRRQVLGGIVGTTAAVLTGATVLEAKGKRKDQGKRQDQGKGKGSAGAPGKQPKVGLCHLDEESGAYTYLELPPPAAKAHVKHGDQELNEADCLALNTAPEETPEV